MNYLLFLPVGFFTYWAYKKANPILYYLMFIASLVAGFEFPGNNTTSLSVSISVGFFIFAFFSIVMFFRYLFWPEEKPQEKADEED